MKRQNWIIDALLYLLAIIVVFGVVGWLAVLAVTLNVAVIFAVFAFGNPIIMVRRRFLSTFLLEHLSALTRLGLPVNDALTAFSDRFPAGMRHDVDEVQDGLMRGLLVGDALGRVPARMGKLIHLSPFSRLVSPAEAETLRVGEMSGDLHGAVRLVLQERERSTELRALLVMSFLYPLWLCTVMVAMLWPLCTYIMPRMIRMMEELSVSIPTLTRLTADSGDLVFKNLHWVVLGLLAAAVAIRLFPRRPHLRDEPFQPLRYVMGLHFFLKSSRNRMLAEFCREMAMLLRVGTSPHRALSVLSDGTLNPWLRDRVCRAAELCEHGASLSDALDQARVDSRSAWFARAAGNGRDLAGSFDCLADAYRDRSSMMGTTFARLLPPTLVLATGCVVCVLVVGFFLPILQLVGALLE